MDTMTTQAGRLDGYLNDHLAGSAAALQLAKRYRDREPESELGHVLQALIAEIEEDRRVLEQVLDALGGSPNGAKRATALGTEMLASLRHPLPVLGSGSSEVARLEEVELLSLGIEGKRLLWRALGAFASADPRLDAFDFGARERRAKAQRDRLERFRLELAERAFGH